MDLDLTDEQQLDPRDRARASPTARSSRAPATTTATVTSTSSSSPRWPHQGYLGAIVPREYGGAGLDYLTYGLIVEEVGRGDSAMRTVVSVQTSLVCSSILRWGTEEQKHNYLPKLCSGEWLGCFGLTEPDTGSDAANQRTRARRTDGGWGSRARKMWISMGNHAKVALIFAQTDPEKAHRGLACFLVDTDQPGFTSQEIHGKMGLHGSDTAELVARRRRGLRRGHARRGRRRLQGRDERAGLGALQRRRPAASASARAASTTRSPTPRSAQQFGRPIASFQLVQAMLADMKVKTDAARLLVWRAGLLKDQGRPNTTETSIAKLYATEAAVECANTAIQVHGGSGYVDDHPVERYFRDVRVTTLYEGTSQIQKLIIGRALTGINALVPS